VIFPQLAEGTVPVRKLLLLVEDNDSDEKLAIRALRKCGVEFEVEVVRDGAEALDRLTGDGPMPELVLLDLNLPKFGGLEVLARLRKHHSTKHLPVVVLTASREHEDISRSYACGANAYVRKPIDFHEFSEAARSIGRFWMSLNEVSR
jgi:two-component system response regulator